jgi:hypothetical protein
MPLISEIVVQELLKESNTYADKYTLSIKIAGKNLSSDLVTLAEKEEINRILKVKKIPFQLS